MLVIVVGVGFYGKLFYFRNMLFGGKLVLFIRNFEFNLYLKILNIYNCIWLEYYLWLICILFLLFLKCENI